MQQQINHKLFSPIELTVKLFAFFRSCEKQKTIPSLEELESFFSPIFEVISNGKTVCRNICEYQNHFRTIWEHFSETRCSSFLDEPIVAENRVVVRYNADVIDKSGTQKQFQIIAILSFEQGKVVSWIETLNETQALYWNDK